jgi:hypothetical protein
MLRIDRKTQRFVPLAPKALPELGLLERSDIQQMIRTSPAEFFGEMGEELLLVGEEVKPSELVGDRIDLLGIDRAGAAVVIELKRGSNKLQLLQALSYAAMISKWGQARFVDERARLTNQPRDGVSEALDEFLESGNGDEINSSQRMILVAERFDWEVLVTAEWLTESYEMDVKCYRLSAAVDGDNEFVTCTCIFPAPELSQHVARRGGTSSKRIRFADWDAALEGIENEGVRAFYRDRIADNTPSDVGRRGLRFQVQGRTLFWVRARRKAVYVWQRARFSDDVNFWRTLLGDASKAEPVKEGRALRFYLHTGEDCAKFYGALKDLESRNFSADLVEEDKTESADALAE